MKKKMLLLPVLVISALLVLSFTFSSDATGDFKYVGVSKCVTCHKSDAQGKQLDIWQNSKHAGAWKTLETEEADKIAKDKGFNTKAVETAACVKCHVLGKDIDPAQLEDSFDKTQGVQCESCHGPGSEYKSLSVMKDKQKAVENGLVIPANKEEFCTGCHNDGSPTFKGFNFEEAWAKIKHNKP